MPAKDTQAPACSSLSWCPHPLHGCSGPELLCPGSAPAWTPPGHPLDTPCPRGHLCWLPRFHIHGIPLHPVAGTGDKSRHLLAAPAGCWGSQRTIPSRVRCVLTCASAQTPAEAGITALGELLPPLLQPPHTPCRGKCSPSNPFPGTTGTFPSSHRALPSPELQPRRAEGSAGSSGKKPPVPVQRKTLQPWADPCRRQIQQNQPSPRKTGARQGRSCSGAEVVPEGEEEEEEDVVLSRAALTRWSCETAEQHRQHLPPPLAAYFSSSRTPHPSSYSLPYSIDPNQNRR